MSEDSDKEHIFIISTVSGHLKDGKIVIDDKQPKKLVIIDEDDWKKFEQLSNGGLMRFKTCPIPKKMEKEKMSEGVKNES